MISPNVATRVLEAALSTGADFAEIFVEETESSELRMIDSKPSKAMVGRVCGAGIRLFFGQEQVYTTTNDLGEEGLVKAARLAAASRPGHAATSTVQPFKSSGFDSVRDLASKHSAEDRRKKLEFLVRLDKAARARNSLVVQVEPSLTESLQRVLVANSLGVWAEDERKYATLRMSALLEDGGAKEESADRIGALGASDYFESLDLESFAASTVDRAALLIHADFAPAGEMPVVIDNGFGGVIFHEACGHGLETTSVAKNASVFCGKLGEKIARDCVTAIDDGTIEGAWGTIAMDDEGMPTKRTVLIENGVLKSYIVDQMGAKQTGYERTGSGRRQNYKYAPASRMRNTFIAPGTDKLEDMIRDVDHGIYAKKMGGGSVSPGTGDYNFGVVEAYLIKNGKIDKPVKGATLIGRGIETLGRITKVGADLSLEAGVCGSVSGAIPTTVGQPPILVSKIVVGGRAS